MPDEIRRNIDTPRLRGHHRLMWRIRALERGGAAGAWRRKGGAGGDPSLDRAGGGRRRAWWRSLLTRRHPAVHPSRPRPHAWPNARSCEAMLRELLGRVGGTCGGKGGSMHIADFDVGNARGQWRGGRQHRDRRRGRARDPAEGRGAVWCAASSAMARSIAGRSWRGLNWAAVFKLCSAVRVRGQRLRRDHAHGASMTAGRRRLGAGAGVRDRGGGGGRE